MALLDHFVKNTRLELDIMRDPQKFKHVLVFVDTTLMKIMRVCCKS